MGKRVHFIGLGGNRSHNLAIELVGHGYAVSGSSKALFEPAKSRLQAAGLLPTTLGWNPDLITDELDLVVVGSTVRTDNPELNRARQLGLHLVSGPELLRELARNKQRIVLTGAMGNSTLAAMVLHVTAKLGYKLDYAVNSSLVADRHALSLSDDATAILIETSEEPASVEDPRPAFLVYEPHIVVLTALGWDGALPLTNQQEYLWAYERLLNDLTKAGILIYNKDDRQLRELAKKYVRKEYHFPYPYEDLPHRQKGGELRVKVSSKTYTLPIYGDHNVSLLSAALELGRVLAIEPDEFLSALQDYSGANRQLETVLEGGQLTVIRDYNYTPLRAKATIDAVAERYKGRRLVVVLELDEPASLNRLAWQAYQGVFKETDHTLVFIDPNRLEAQNLPPVEPDALRKAFADPTLELLQSRDDLLATLRRLAKGQPTLVLLLSAGALGGFRLDDLNA